LSYRMPHSFSMARLPDWLAGWTVSSILRARTGFPIDVRASEQGLGRGFDNIGRPDRAPEVPAWIDDPLVAGHRRLNPAAFLPPPEGMPGNLGRNAVSGNGLLQWDASVRREFRLFRGMSLEVGINVFNVLNHPAFANPVPFL